MILGTQPSLRDIVDALEAAETDPRVKGVLARVGSDDIGFATAQQIRDAIAAFRAKGKFAIAFSDSFGEFGAGTRPIIWPPPSTKSGCNRWAASD